ncbi:hypothetical protein V6N11_067148 [Hibiscus sabdariffa]|uniref:Uncharacterized protein n=1 Tax=Hibiscus sabdariffa TaxID=183260 RepID=A0ABR2AG00_9ROSI
MALRNCSSQKEYSRLLDFEHRDLRLRESKFECFTLFQGVLSQNPALREDAAYHPTESFMDFFSEKRDALDQETPECTPAYKDFQEIELIQQVKDDLQTRGHESSYMLKLLGSGEGSGKGVNLDRERVCKSRVLTRGQKVEEAPTVRLPRNRKGGPGARASWVGV